MMSKLLLVLSFISSLTAVASGDCHSGLFGSFTCTDPDLSSMKAYKLELSRNSKAVYIKIADNEKLDYILGENQAFKPEEDGDTWYQYSYQGSCVQNVLILKQQEVIENSKNRTTVVNTLENVYSLTAPNKIAVYEKNVNQGDNTEDEFFAVCTRD